MTTKGTILYLPHGGGPLPLLGHPGHQGLVSFLKEAGQSLPRPRAVVVISAHWETDIPVATAHEAPKMIYDYFGFPEKAYQIKYPAPGDPALAKEAVALLTRAGVKARTDDTRGFDHGLYIPLTLMLPKADVPCIQISLCADLDPSTHLRLGQALTPLADQKIWLLGSGFSFHNMAAFKGLGPDRNQTLRNQIGQDRIAPDPAVEDQIDRENNAFQDWLSETCTSSRISSDQRKERLIRWEWAPHARTCHPREEHLLPLLVCAGAAGYTTARPLFDGPVMGRRALGLVWQKA